MKNKQAIIIIPYFGQWPAYFGLFLKSCINNNWLDILFFTDCPIPESYPKNVKFISISFEEVFDLINSKLLLGGFIPSNAYKLCDLKPSYGFIFSDYVEEYKYWGYGDIDLFYGELGSKVISKMEMDFDVISARAEIVSGSFTLIKNNDYNNQLFKKLENFENLAVSYLYEGIDETSHNAQIWSGFKKLDLPKSCFTYLVAREHELKNIKASFETFICEYLANFSLIKYKNGNLIFKKDKIGYFHYVMNKSRSYFTYPMWETLPKFFYINNTGFHKNRLSAWLISPLVILSYYVKKMPKYISKKLKR